MATEAVTTPESVEKELLKALHNMLSAISTAQEYESKAVLADASAKLLNTEVGRIAILQPTTDGR